MKNEISIKSISRRILVLFLLDSFLNGDGYRAITIALKEFVYRTMKK